MDRSVKRIVIGAFIVQALRQPSTYQVHHNLESQQLQYAMQERLRILAWKEIEVIDEDLGCSAAGTVTRSGFERAWWRKYAWAKWAQWPLWTPCWSTKRHIYDPRQSNHRLLLGLKGKALRSQADGCNTRENTTM